jgi:FkbM family methyltransferase
MRLLSNRAGMEIIGVEFSGIGAFALTTIFKMRPALREALLFGKSSFCLPLQKVLFWLLGGARMVETKFTDGPMAGDTFSCWTSEKYFMLGSHLEADAQVQFAQIIRPGEIVYDVGGHAGYMSLLFSSLVGPNGRVFTFEPSPVNYPRLRRNIEANHKANVVLTNAAVSDQDGVAGFREGGTMSHIVTGNATQGDAIINVRTIRLDDFVYGESHPVPDFLKLDIEGHAGAALGGMKRILSERHPKMFVELHDESEERQATEILGANGYKFEVLERDQRFPRRVIATADMR